jgi:hypothetical protein
MTNAIATTEIVSVSCRWIRRRDTRKAERKSVSPACVSNASAGSFWMLGRCITSCAQEWCRGKSTSPCSRISHATTLVLAAWQRRQVLLLSGDWVAVELARAQASFLAWKGTPRWLQALPDQVPS